MTNRTAQTPMRIAPQATLSERACQILTDVVESYSSTGQPVGSKALVEGGKLDLSPASVRNVMQDLEKQGLLMHPHTSAGRIPTESGFRYYATQLVQLDKAEVSDAAKKAIASVITPSKSKTTLIKDVSDVLGELTGCASLVTAPKREDDPLEQVEFIRLSGDRVLVVMVTSGGHIENRMIDVPAFIDTDELNKASKELKKLIAGQTLDQARQNMILGLAEQRGRVNEMIDQMMLAAHEWGRPTVSDGAMVVAGSNNLFRYPELVRDKLQGLVKMFEEKRLLMALMEEVKRGHGVQVYIGAENPLVQLAAAEAYHSKDVIQDCAMIASAYGNKADNIIGTLGVIGPLRMNYKHTVGLVNYTGKMLSALLTPEAKSGE
ncbi:MAG: heat-inducible transcriptional repressor HrcA [Alphaproteobacteria bacterium]